MRWEHFFICFIPWGDGAHIQLPLLTASVGLRLLEHGACLRQKSAGGGFNDLGRIEENLYRTSKWFRCDLFLNFRIVWIKFIVKNLIICESDMASDKWDSRVPGVGAVGVEFLLHALKFGVDTPPGI